MKKINSIILVDDHELFREGLGFVLERLEGVKVIGEAANGKEFLSLMKKKNPDLVLMDISMPVMDGLEATEKALELYPDLKIITLTMYGDEEYYFKMINAGVKGFVLKDAGRVEFERAIREVLDGRNYFSQELLRKIIFNIGEKKVVQSSKNEVVKLSNREFDVLRLICAGLTNSEVADRLNISIKTVEGHKTNLMTKTNTRNSISLIMFAIKNKLIRI